jgi:carboxymethylenebutenolidase
VLGLYGELDLGITQASVGRMKAALASSANPVARECRIVTYPDAGHAFHADYRPSYHQPSAEDGWKRAVKWLNQRLNAEG